MFVKMDCPGMEKSLENVVNLTQEVGFWGDTEAGHSDRRQTKVEGTLTRQSYKGPVMAVLSESVQIPGSSEPCEVIYVARGVYLHTIRASGGSDWISVRAPIAVLDDHIHGLRLCEGGEWNGTEPILAFGQQYFQVVPPVNRLENGNVDGGEKATLSWQRTNVGDWIVDARFFNQSNQIVLGLAHNFVEVWERSQSPSTPGEVSFECRSRVRCYHPSLLYSCAVLPNLNDGSLLIASGTVYQHILVQEKNKN